MNGAICFIRIILRGNIHDPAMYPPIGERSIA